MLENKTISSIAVEESIANIVFDPGWKSVYGSSVDLQQNLYRNNTGRMLMWSFEMVTTSSNSVYSSHFQPYLVDTEETSHPRSTSFRWNTDLPGATGTGWYISQSGNDSLGTYRFASHGGHGKWNMLPQGFSLNIMTHAAMGPTLSIDYKLTVVEEDASLLVNRN
jgi:hypothetical protein